MQLQQSGVFEAGLFALPAPTAAPSRDTLHATLVNKEKILLKNGRGKPHSLDIGPNNRILGVDQLPRARGDAFETGRIERLGSPKRAEPKNCSPQIDELLCIAFLKKTPSCTNAVITHTCRCQYSANQTWGDEGVSDASGFRPDSKKGGDTAQMQ